MPHPRAEKIRNATEAYLRRNKAIFPTLWELIVAEKKKRIHKATYATDKRNGGYLIRVAGPHANEFSGREVPVTLKSGDEQSEKLTRMIWTGADKETGEKVALYKFEAKPRAETEKVEF